MRVFALSLSFALVAAAPPPTTAPSEPYQKLRDMIAPVSGARMKATVEKLVSFGTRHTLSSQTDPKRGIGAALGWTDGQFKSFGLGTLRLCDTVSGDRLPGPTHICDAVAIQRGTERPNDVVIITGHIDSRVTDVMNSDAVEPGANDDGSGTAAVIESARVLSKHKFPGTIIYAAVSGEEQGLYGSEILAKYGKVQGWNVIADLNNDIVGNSCSSDGICDSTHARVLSEGPRSQGQTDLMARTHSLGGENDAPSRNLSRFLDGLADHLDIGLDVRQIWRTDRYGRGGDHIPFLEQGFPAARLSVAVENYNWQHQDVRVENGIHYGDTVDHMDFAYLAKMTKLDAAFLAAIASAPPPPAPTAEGAVSTDTTLTWSGVPGASSFNVHRRRTDESNWSVSSASKPDCIVLTFLIVDPKTGKTRAPAGSCKLVLPHIRVDDWIFGVSSVSRDGFESPVASAVPGGTFKPYIAPEKK